MPDLTARRIADNESRFREINERLEADLRRLPAADDEPVEFVCECGRTDCTEPVRVRLAEYERVRQDPLLFVLVPGHDLPEVETVLTETDRYVVVRKKPPTHPIVEARDPRGGAR